MSGEAERCCHKVRFETRKCTKCVSGRGSAPGPAGRAYRAPPNPVAGFEEESTKGEMERAMEMYINYSFFHIYNKIDLECAMVM